MTFRIAQKGEERSIFQEAWVSDFMAFISLLGEMCCYDMTGTLFNFEIILDLHKSYKNSSPFPYNTHPVFLKVNIFISVLQLPKPGN